MLRKLIVENNVGDVLEMELSNPWETGLAIYDITGLGPGPAQIITTPTSYMDGSLFNSSKKENRNIVISMYPLETENGSVQLSQHKSYKMFPLKRRVKLTFISDARTAYIEGYVESNEVVMFSEQSTIQISIICVDPYFYRGGDGELQETMFSGSKPEFKFAFGNAPIDKKELVMGDLETKVEYNVINHGDSEVGVTIVIDAFGGADNIRIYNLTTNQHIKISSDRLAALTGSKMIAGDQIIITTDKGYKGATLIRDGKKHNILNVLDRDVEWIYLSVGDNMFTFTADTNAESHPSNATVFVRNKTRYEGI